MAWCRGRVGWQRFVSSILSVVSLLTLWGTKQRTNLPKSWHINTLTKLGRSKTIAIFIYYIYLSSLSLSSTSHILTGDSHPGADPGGSWPWRISCIWFIIRFAIYDDCCLMILDLTCLDNTQPRLLLHQNWRWYIRDPMVFYSFDQRSFNSIKSKCPNYSLFIIMICDTRPARQGRCAGVPVQIQCCFKSRMSMTSNSWVGNIWGILQI